MPGFSPHARGYKSMLSHCCLPPKQFPRGFLVCIQGKPNLAFLINPCYTRSRRVGTPREPEISGQEKAEAEGPTFVQGEGSQPAHHFSGRPRVSRLCHARKTGKSIILTVRRPYQRRQPARALTSATAA